MVSMTQPAAHYTASGTCRDCPELFTGIEARLRAIQHHKATGHETRVQVESVEIFGAKRPART